MSNPLQPCGLQSTRLLCPSDFPGKNIGVVALSSSKKGSFQSRDWTHISCIAGGFFTAEPSGKSFLSIYFQPMSVLKPKILFFLSELWGYVLFSLLSVSALKFTDSFVGSFVYDKLLSMAVITIKVIDFWQLNYCVSQNGFLWFFKIWGSLCIKDFYVHFFPRFGRFSDIVTLNKLFSPFSFSLLLLDSYWSISCCSINLLSFLFFFIFFLSIPWLTE